MEELQTDVLIVGGGPVGLASAIELGLRGVNCLLIERRDGSIPHPRMSGVSARTMEFCRRWGLGETVVNAGWPPDYPRRILFVTSMKGYLLADYNFGSDLDRPPVTNSPYRFQRTPQMWFDPILREFASKLPPVTMRYMTEYRAFEERGDRVVALAVDRTTGAELSISARYVLACDGTKSAIRSQLGVPMEGATDVNMQMSIYFDSEALLGLHDKGKSTMNWMVGEEGVWACLSSYDGRKMWRLWMSQVPADTDFSNFDADRHLRRALGADFDYRITGVTPWERNQRIAASYRVGRIFLAGDAAHTLTPTGGFGMNTGIQDAVDICWKLAAVLQGWGDEALLDTYEMERRPVGVRNVDEAGRNFDQLAAVPRLSGIDAATDAGEIVRRRVSDFIYANELQREYINEGIVLGYVYDKSPICLHDDDSAVPLDVMKYRQSSRPGGRAPHVWLSDGRSTLDRMGLGFTLFRIGQDAPDISTLLESFAAIGAPIEAADIADQAALDVYGFPLVLIRPDGHVAWRGNRPPADPNAIARKVTGHISA